MSRRECEDQPAGLELGIGSSVLKAVAHASWLLAGGLALAALLGTAPVAIPVIALACAAGIAATTGADVLRRRAAEATKEERRERAEAIHREHSRGEAAHCAMEADHARGGHLQRLHRRRHERIRSTECSLVTAEQTHILTVVATDPLYVSFTVPEAILLQLRRDGLSDPGKLDVAVGFAIDEGYPHAAKLDAIEPEVDPETGTVRFRATVPNPKGLLSPGMSARVRLTPAPK